MKTVASFEQRNGFQQAIVFLAVVAVLLMSVATTSAETTWPHTVLSQDGTPISYEVHGAGDPTLVFVHGWSCDARYWRYQVPYFSQDHQVVVIDLGGHGHSGLDRERYTMEAFGQDVEAVVRTVGAEQLILIGHSMGGPVIANAARLMPQRVVGLVGVDTYQNVEQEMNREAMEEWLDPFRTDYREATGQFVARMFVPETDEKLRNWVIADMSAAPPRVALSAMEQMLTDYLTGAAAATFDGLEIPVVTINADLWPTDIEANRRHMHSFDVIIMEGTDHFLHMARSDTFNRKLELVIRKFARVAERDD